MSQEDENKPIYNMRLYSEKSDGTKKESDNILSWKKSSLCSYLRGVFDGRGMIYFNDSKERVLSIHHSTITKLEIYQKALQMLNIHSFLYYPQYDDEQAELFIVGKRNIERFKDKIGFDYPEEADIFYNYWKKLDWED